MTYLVNTIVQSNKILLNFITRDKLTPQKRYINHKTCDKT